MENSPLFSKRFDVRLDAEQPQSDDLKLMKDWEVRLCSLLECIKYDTSSTSFKKATYIKLVHN